MTTPPLGGRNPEETAAERAALAETTGFSPVQVATLETMINQVRADMDRHTRAATRSRRARLVGVALGAAAVASPQGQQAAQWAARTAADGLTTAVDAAQRAYVSGVHATQDEVGRKADEGQRLADQVAETGRTGWESFQGELAEARDTVTGAANTAGREATAGARELWEGVSGFAVEAWDKAWRTGAAVVDGTTRAVDQTMDAARQVGDVAVHAATEAYGGVAAYGAEVASNPSHLVTAAIAAGAAVALSPDARRAVAQAANSASRWVRGAAGSAATLAVRVCNAVRANPRIRQALAAVHLGPKDILGATAAATQAGRHRADALAGRRDLVPGTDPALRSASGAVDSTAGGQQVAGTHPSPANGPHTVRGADPQGPASGR